MHPLTRPALLQEEGNRRTLEPWRTYLLTPSWFQHRRRVRQLNQYIIGALLCSPPDGSAVLRTLILFHRHDPGTLAAPAGRRKAGAHCARFSRGATHDLAA